MTKAGSLRVPLDEIQSWDQKEPDDLSSGAVAGHYLTTMRTRKAKDKRGERGGKEEKRAGRKRAQEIRTRDSERVPMMLSPSFQALPEAWVL